LASVRNREVSVARGSTVEGKKKNSFSKKQKQMLVSVDLVLICFSAFCTVQNPTPSSGAAAPNAGPEAVQSWPQVHNQPQQRPVPPPGGGQPVTQDTVMNPTQGSQRALAWTGHLEWQDTVSCFIMDRHTFLGNCLPTPPLSQY